MNVPLTKANAHHGYLGDEVLHGNKACVLDLYSISQFSALSFRPEDHDNLVFELAAPMALPSLVVVTTCNMAKVMQATEDATVAILEVDIARQVVIILGMDQVIVGRKADTESQVAAIFAGVIDNQAIVILGIDQVIVGRKANTESQVTAVFVGVIDSQAAIILGKGIEDQVIADFEEITLNQVMVVLFQVAVDLVFVVNTADTVEISMADVIAIMFRPMIQVINSEDLEMELEAVIVVTGPSIEGLHVSRIVALFTLQKWAEAIPLSYLNCQSQISTINRLFLLLEQDLVDSGSQAVIGPILAAKERSSVPSLMRVENPLRAMAGLGAMADVATMADVPAMAQLGGMANAGAMDISARVGAVPHVRTLTHDQSNPQNDDLYPSKSVRDLYGEKYPNGSLQHEDVIHYVEDAFHHEQSVVLVKQCGSHALEYDMGVLVVKYESRALDSHMGAWVARDRNNDLSDDAPHSAFRAHGLLLHDALRL